MLKELTKAKSIVKLRFRTLLQFRYLHISIYVQTTSGLYIFIHYYKFIYIYIMQVYDVQAYVDICAYTIFALAQDSL